MPGKEKLAELEKLGEYVFHGSLNLVDILEPRQAYNYPGLGPEDKIPDGVPAVFASSNSAVAIFMAIFSKRGGRSGFSMNEKGEFKLRVTPSTWNGRTGIKAYVYVLDKELFTPNLPNPIEFIATKAVKPLKIIEVNENDLPQGIEIYDF